MTAPHYLSLSAPGQFARAPISPTLNPFGVLSTNPLTYSNLDVRMYFGTSSYLPPPPVPTPYIYVYPGYTFCSTYNWAIGLDTNGYLTWTQERFNYPERNDELGSYLQVVKATAPVSFDNLSPDGFYFRAYINAYGTGANDAPGQNQATPNITFFTSSDAGVTFVQVGETVPLPVKVISEQTSMTYLSENGPQVCGPIVELWPQWTSNAIYLACGAHSPDPGSYNGTIPDMQVYAFSMQDSRGRYLAKVDFTPGIPYTKTVLQPYTTDPEALALDTSYSFTDSAGAQWIAENGAVIV